MFLCGAPSDPVSRDITHIMTQFTIPKALRRCVNMFLVCHTYFHICVLLEEQATHIKTQFTIPKCRTCPRVPLRNL
jgi:hypothetical protein